ncbi:hypothetical protein AX17_004781 [Amanita inopinata Kibby_2008]|nr:hypothetical protein AX17_004781 [Amanita inopinata Kibby_2008]
MDVKNNIDDASPIARYSPSDAWKTSGSTQLEYDGTTHLTNTSGATVTLTFNGSVIAVFGTIATDGGRPRSSYRIDNSSAIYEFDPTPPTNQSLYQQKFYQSPALESGTHELTVTCLANNGTLVIDYFMITTPSSTQTVATLPETITTHQSSARRPPSTAGIVGGVIGGISLLLAGIMFALWIFRRRGDYRYSMFPKSSTKGDSTGSSIWKRLGLANKKDPVVTPFGCAVPSTSSSDIPRNAIVNGTGDRLTTTRHTASHSTTTVATTTRSQTPQPGPTPSKTPLASTAGGRPPWPTINQLNRPTRPRRPDEWSQQTQVSQPQPPPPSTMRYSSGIYNVPVSGYILPDRETPLPTAAPSTVGLGDIYDAPFTSRVK